jgi:hypothetical protein
VEARLKVGIDDERRESGRDGRFCRFCVMESVAAAERLE